MPRADRRAREAVAAAGGVPPPRGPPPRGYPNWDAIDGVYRNDNGDTPASAKERRAAEERARREREKQEKLAQRATSNAQSVVHPSAANFFADASESDDEPDDFELYEAGFDSHGGSAGAAASFDTWNQSVVRLLKRNRTFRRWERRECGDGDDRGAAFAAFTAKGRMSASRGERRALAVRRSVTIARRGTGGCFRANRSPSTLPSVARQCAAR